MKRTLAIILSLVMLFSVLPLTASAADVDTADTGAEELSIIQQPANCYIYSSPYHSSLYKYKPYLRFSVAGATANTTYEWYYDLDDEYAVGEKIATTKVPELQVDKVGWYRCWVKDTNGQSLITQSALVRDTKYLAETSIPSKSRFRINGTMLQWKESPLVDALGNVCVRYTLKAIRHDHTHDTTSDLNFKIQYFSNGEVEVNKFSGSTIIGDFSEQYPATFDSTKKIFSMDLRNIIGQDQNYSDITYQFFFYTNVFNGDFSTNIIRDEVSQLTNSGEYTAKELYNGEVYYNIGGQYENEVWIEDKEYTVGDTLYANIYGGRWADKFPSVKWQRVDSHGNWLDTGTIGKNYTVTDADVVNERINRIRCVVIPYIGRISGEVYYDDEIFVSNRVDVKKSTCTVTFDKNGGSGTMNSVTVNKGSSYKLPECTFTPPTNKQFKNWKIGSSYYKTGDTVTVNSNITAYAQWEDAKYTVTFDKNGGSGTMNPVTVNGGSSYKLPACTFTPPTNKQFKNWKIGSSYYNPGDTVTVNSNITVYAQWEDDKYTITFDKNGGTGTMNPVTVYKGSSYTLPACTFTAPENKKFKYWKIGNTFYSPGESFTVTSNITAYAYWINTSGIAERVDITVTAPKANELPSYDVSVYGSGNVITGNEVPVSGSPGVYTQYKGVLWRDMTTRKNQRSNAAFVDGHEYRVSVDLKSLAGTNFNFEDDSKPMTQIYINGSAAEIQPAAIDNTICTAMYTFSVSSGSTVSGSYTSYIDSYQATKIELLQNDTVKYATASSGSSGSYSIPNVANGEYTLRVSKANHVTRDYTITVSGDTAQNVKIHPKGDINGDGKVTSRDFGMAYAHAQKLKDSTLTGYALNCADVVKNDGKVTTSDAARINAHIQKTDPLW